METVGHSFTRHRGKPQSVGAAAEKMWTWMGCGKFRFSNVVCGLVVKGDNGGQTIYGRGREDASVAVAEAQPIAVKDCVR
jgi:hypothetical protein